MMCDPNSPQLRTNSRSVCQILCTEACTLWRRILSATKTPLKWKIKTNERNYPGLNFWTFTFLTIMSRKFPSVSSQVRTFPIMWVLYPSSFRYCGRSVSLSDRPYGSEPRMTPCCKPEIYFIENNFSSSNKIHMNGSFKSIERNWHIEWSIRSYSHRAKAKPKMIKWKR